MQQYWARGIFQEYADGRVLDPLPIRPSAREKPIAAHAPCINRASAIPSPVKQHAQADQSASPAKLTSQMQPTVKRKQADTSGTDSAREQAAVKRRRGSSAKATAPVRIPFEEQTEAAGDPGNGQASESSPAGCSNGTRGRARGRGQANATAKGRGRGFRAQNSANSPPHQKLEPKIDEVTFGTSAPDNLSADYLLIVAASATIVATLHCHAYTVPCCSA